MKRLGNENPKIPKKFLRYVLHWPKSVMTTLYDHLMRSKTMKFTDQTGNISDEKVTLRVPLSYSDHLYRDHEVDPAIMVEQMPKLIGSNVYYEFNHDAPPMGKVESFEQREDGIYITSVMTEFWPDTLGALMDNGLIKADELTYGTAMLVQDSEVVDGVTLIKRGVLREVSIGLVPQDQLKRKQDA